MCHKRTSAVAKTSELARLSIRRSARTRRGS